MIKEYVRESSELHGQRRNAKKNPPRRTDRRSSSTA
jgi:hypothetical protein